MLFEEHFKMTDINKYRILSVAIFDLEFLYTPYILILKYLVYWYGGGGGGANTKVPDMYGVGGGVFSGPKTQK